MADACPICGSSLKSPSKPSGMGIDAASYECLRCGNFSLTGSVLATLPTQLQTDERAAIKISHALYSMTERVSCPTVDSILLTSILSSTSSPNLPEQLDNLILWLAKNQLSPGEPVRGSSRTEAATGVANRKSLLFLLAHAVDSGLITGSFGATSSGADDGMQLTFKGWDYFGELQRGNGSSRMAFMAMQFGDKESDAIYRDQFKTAVAATGFDLKRLDEGQPAGLIDDRLRVEIRQSRFLIADLTHHNKGAYWEAGYAEGLGKPVIYTCRSDAFSTEGTHFDTNHHLTVIWDPDKIGDAVERLKATIRATLPGEAKLSDEERR